VATIHCLKNPFLCICLCCTTTSQRPGPGPPHACRSIATHAKSAVHVLCRTSKSPCLPHCCFPIQARRRTSPAPEAWSPHHRPTSVKVKPRPTLPWKKACKPSSSNFEMHGSPMHRPIARFHQLHVCFVPGRPAVVNRSKRNGGATRSISVSMRSSS
jgi:hypothetical protein